MKYTEQECDNFINYIMSDSLMNLSVKAPRKSNMELLRILAMFMVLGVHANFYALSTPTQATIESNVFASATRIVLCIVCCMCVNIFILISGWFSIKPSVKGFLRFIFQCLYFTIGIYIVMIILGEDTINLSSLKNCFFLSKWDWFIKAYIGLYILAPILNLFIDKSTQKQVLIFIISFYIFQTIFSIRGAATFIASGYSTFSFIGLYILGRYLNKYGINKISNWTLLITIVFIILIISIVYFFDALNNTFMFSGMCMSYANPIMIVAASALTVLFARIKMKTNYIINWISASAFAAYLFHFDPHILEPWFCETSRLIFSNYNGLSCLFFEILFIIGVFLLAVILDQPRKIIWHRIEIWYGTRKFA